MNSPVFDPLDHLVYATPDLAGTVADLESRLGVSIRSGGRHPGWGTRNAILSLGGRTYMEIVGLDEDQPEAAGRRVFGVDDLTSPRLVTWAVGTADIRARRAALLEEGFDLGDILPGERLRPDGTRLSWSLTDPYATRFGGVVPFLISWGDCDHPGATDAECTLVRFRVRHPLSVGLEAALGRAGIHVQVDTPAPGQTAGLTALLRRPAGEVELS